MKRKNQGFFLPTYEVLRSKEEIDFLTVCVNIAVMVMKFSTHPANRSIMCNVRVTFVKFKLIPELEEAT